MTVKELIEKLKKFKQDLEVECLNYNDDLGKDISRCDIEDISYDLETNTVVIS